MTCIPLCIDLFLIFIFPGASRHRVKSAEKIRSESDESCSWAVDQIQKSAIAKQNSRVNSNMMMQRKKDNKKRPIKMPTSLFCFIFLTRSIFMRNYLWNSVCPPNFSCTSIWHNTLNNLLLWKILFLVAE